MFPSMRGSLPAARLIAAIRVPIALRRQRVSRPLSLGSFVLIDLSGSCATFACLL